MNDHLGDWLWMLFDAEPDGAFVEVRQLGSGRPPFREFLPIVDLERAAGRILKLGRERNTYVGVAPRCRREGGKGAIEHCWSLWADCDGPAAVDRLAELEPAPTLVVWSGTPRCAHAYWRLTEPALPVDAEVANRRLAHALDADMASTDVARILRPPETLNFKSDPPAGVLLDRWRGGTYTLQQVAGHLADPPSGRAPREPCERPPRTQGAVQDAGDDALLMIEPAVYVRALTGREVARAGKIRCPLGCEDRTPSFHVYPTAQRGWYAFCCGRGGTIYDLGRELSGIGDRGADFARLREWIAERLLSAPVGAAA